MSSPLAPRPSPPIAQVVFNLPIDRPFDYRIPEALREQAEAGRRVLAPFGPRERVGLIVALRERSRLLQLKSIRRVLDPWPVIADERWELAQWLRGYYGCSLGESLAVMVPSVLRLRAAPLSDITRPVPRHLTLTEAQRRAFGPLAAALDAGAARTVLLHGVTGPGKTELYLQAIDRTLGQGRSAICLVPEIALTPQTIDRFRERFGDLVAVWHSRLGARERAAGWADVAQGARRIVGGARSAVFAPVQKLGLLILDEEQESTYKQEDTPRYHAREAARARIRLTGGVLLLGSATRSVESYHDATVRSASLLTLPERIEGRPLPQVQVVDLREQLAAHRRAGPFSVPLEHRSEERRVGKE